MFYISASKSQFMWDLINSKWLTVEFWSKLFPEPPGIPYLVIKASLKFVNHLSIYFAITQLSPIYPIPPPSTNKQKRAKNVWPLLEIRDVRMFYSIKPPTCITCKRFNSIPFHTFSKPFHTFYIILTRIVDIWKFGHTLQYLSTFFGVWWGWWWWKGSRTRS